VAGVGTWDISYTYQDPNTGCINSCSFEIEVKNPILNHLQAITGPSEHCFGNSAIVPVEVNQFNQVATFQMKLKFNVNNLMCEGMTNIHPLLEAGLEGFVNQESGEIILKWHSDAGYTFGQMVTVAELIFIPKIPSVEQLEWYTGANESYFEDINGTPILAEFLTSEIIIYNPPEIFLDEEITICEGEALSIASVANCSYPPLNLEWTYPDGQVHSADPNFSYVRVSHAGDYILRATDAMGCTDQKTIRLIVGQKPLVSFHNIDTLITYPGYILHAGYGSTFYKWNTGETTESIVIMQEGNYEVELTSWAGCTAIDSIYILFPNEEIDRKCLFIPNAFSPNGDGINDIFIPVSGCADISGFIMLIFNRWGELIFESHDFSIGWDGLVNGIPCPVDVYSYNITYQTVGGITEEEEWESTSGTVVIVK
jgi:gliding motility-associated-like protein